MQTSRTLRGVWLGRRPYGAVFELQETLRKLRQEGRVGDAILLLEHPPVVTFGRGGRSENLLVPEAFLRDRGVEVVRTDRGGDVTLHAPGQLVGYPILDLKPDRQDVRRYVADLSEAMRRVVLAHGIASGAVPGMVGLWVDSANPGSWDGPERARRLAKIGAIGVRISRWVTMHGFALNVTTELGLFDWIVPCGISQHGVTSIAALTSKRLDLREEAGRMLAVVGEVFQARVDGLRDATEADLASLPPTLT